MNAEEVARRLAVLRDRGAALRERPLPGVHAELGRVLDAWRDPTSPWRRELEAALPEAAGFSAEVVREGLRLGLAEWSGDALLALVRDELGGPERAIGFDTTATLLAGSIPMPTLLSILAPLAVGSPVMAKTASRDPVTAPLVARSIAEIAPALGPCVEVVSVPGSDRAALDALLAAECVVTTGSDETVGAVAARAAGAARVVTHGHGVSVAVLGAAASRGEGLAAAARGIALDTALWDQQGCLSPIAVYVVDPAPASTDRVAAALADALAAIEVRLPRGRVSRAAAGDVAQERAAAEVRAAAGVDTTVRAGEGDRWVVVREPDTRLRPPPLHRFLRVHPVDAAGDLAGALAPLAPHLVGAAVAGFGEAEAAGLREVLARLGVSRRCRPGELQAPPLGWRRGNLDVLGSIARNLQ